MKRESGTGLVEFALIYSTLFVVFAAVFQFGYTMYVYNSLLTSVASAARYAAVRTFDSGTGTPSAQFSSAVSNMAVYGDSGGGSAPRVPGLTPANVRVTVETANNVPTSVAVEIRDYRVNAIFTSFTFTGKPKAAYPYMGRYAPA